MTGAYSAEVINKKYPLPRPSPSGPPDQFFSGKPDFSGGYSMPSLGQSGSFMSPNPGQPAPAPFTPINLHDATSYHALENYANSKGPSPWLSMTNNAIDLQTQQARDQATRDALHAQTGAMDALAMRGGLSGGDAARLASQGMLGGINARQNASLQGTQNKFGAAIQDQQNKLGAQQFLTGQELALQTNAAGALNDYNKFNYGEQNKAYIGNQLANSMGAGGENPGLLGMGGLLGTGIGGKSGVFGTGLFAGSQGQRDAMWTAGGAAVGGPAGAAVGYGASRLGNATGWY